MKRAGSALALVVLSVFVAGRVEASTPEGEEALRLYGEGSSLAAQHRCEQAAPLLERSDALLPSPNTELLLARCYEELGRDEDAVDRFERSMLDAQARVNAGQSKYARTAETARVEGSAVRSRLGTLRVRVASAPAYALVESDRVTRPLRSDGSVEILHRPGVVTVVVRAPGFEEATVTATVVAGRWAVVDLTLKASPPATSTSSPPSPPLPKYEPPLPLARPWQRPVGFGFGVLGLVGAGVFGAFGADAALRHAALDDCSPRCGDAERESADIGKRSQVIANVALVTASVALVSGIVLVLTAPRRRLVAPLE